jgi:envelope integrity protein B
MDVFLMRTIGRLFAGVAVALAAVLPAAPALAGQGATLVAAGAGGTPFSAHRAVYDLSLGETREPSSVETIRGRIVYDFSGSPCAGYALKFRQVTVISVKGGGSNISDLRSTTIEDDAGKKFVFTSQNFVNDKLDTAIDGRAERAAGGGVAVALAKPKHATFDLPQDVVFPTGQMKAIVEAARAGRTVFESKIYDGSDGGEKTYSTLAVIGKSIPADRPGEGAAAGRKELEGVERWPVTISYFDPTKAKGGEETPVYSISFDLYANGISGNIRLDYGDFTLKGEMKTLEFLPQAACP